MKWASVLGILLISASPSFAHSDTPAFQGSSLKLHTMHINSDPLLGPSRKGDRNGVLFFTTLHAGPSGLPKLTQGSPSVTLNGSTDVYAHRLAEISEPATISLLTLGVIGIGWRNYHRRQGIRLKRGGRAVLAH